nr:RNA-directed DNA polymerase, eukaryota [Tanacetum cinerariifolium]
EGHKVKQAANKLGCLILSCPFSYLGSKKVIVAIHGDDGNICSGKRFVSKTCWSSIVYEVHRMKSNGINIFDFMKLRVGNGQTIRFWFDDWYQGGVLKDLCPRINQEGREQAQFNVLEGVVKSVTLVPMEDRRVWNLDSSGEFFVASISRKIDDVRLPNVLASKDKGGLGVSSLFALNRGLLIKWVWRYFNKESSLWKKVIVAIHGDDGNICSGKRFVSKTCWSSIVYEVHRMKSNGINIFDFMKLRVGNGQTIRFWFDDWYQGGVLKDLCPREDRRVWNLDSSGEFFVASISRKIDDVRLPNVGLKTRWVKLVPIKVNVLSWKVMVEALPTRFNMSRRGISIPSIMCPVCDEEVESVNHLFFRCKVCYQLGSKLKEIFEGVWITMWWYRNKILFEDNPPKKADLFDRIVVISYQWCKSRCKATFDWNA